jgi:WD40 repeat protein
MSVVGDGKENSHRHRRAGDFSWSALALVWGGCRLAAVEVAAAAARANGPGAAAPPMRVVGWCADDGGGGGGDAVEEDVLFPKSNGTGAAAAAAAAAAASTRAASTSHSRQSSPCLALEVDDWILDCAVVPGSSASSTSSHNNIITLLVGTAHNCVHVVPVRATLAKVDGHASVAALRVHHHRHLKIQGRPFSIGHSLAICPHSRQVAFGAVTSSIAVWSLQDPHPHPPDGSSSSSSSSSSSAAIASVGAPSDVGNDTSSTDDYAALAATTSTLAGHKGVVHSLRFDSQGTRLVSASDDRTVKLWTKRSSGSAADDRCRNTTSCPFSSSSPPQSSWTCTWTGWGHTARCWSATFTTLPPVHHAPARDLVVSCGEDGTARCWDTTSGEAVAVLRGHSVTSQSVWNVEAWQGIAVTAANNGSLAMFDLRSRLEDQPPERQGLHEEIVTSADDPVPDADPDHDCNAHTNARCGWSSFIRLPAAPQVIVGLDMHQAPPSPDGSAPAPTPSFLLVATRSGSLLKCDTSTAAPPSRGITATEMRPWRSFCHLSNAEATCVSVHPDGVRAAIGTSTGASILVPLRNHGSSNSDQEHSPEPDLCHPEEKSNLKRLAWIADDCLLAFHVKSLVLWRRTRCGTPDSSGAFVGTLLVPGTNGMPICASWNEPTKRLVVGDTRGNLVLFDVASLDFDDHCTRFHELRPVSVVPRAHGREHVNDVSWTSSRTLCSVGNDGCVCECAVDGSGSLLRLLSYAVAPFTGIDRVWTVCASGNATILVGGFCGNVFIVTDVESGYELLRIDTGGRQRKYCLLLDYDGTGMRTNHACFAVALSRTGGGRDLQLWSFRSLGVRICEARRAATAAHPPWSFSPGLHGGTIRAVCARTCGTTTIVVTASDDCTSRVSILDRDGSVVSTKKLTPQANSVRAVCMSRVRGERTRASSDFVPALIVVGGCRLTLQLFVLRRASALDDIEVEYIGKGKLASKSSSIDQRINAVAAISIGSEDSDNAHESLVASGDSEGACYLFAVPAEVQSSYKGHLVFQSERPILCLSLARVLGRILLVAGTSGGELIVHDVTSLPSGELEWPQVFRSKPHMVGANTLDIRVPWKERGVLRICTGGDDQRIHCCEIQVSEGASSAALIRSVTCHNACTTSVCGVSWLDDEHVCATCSGQQLAIFKVSFPRMTRIACTSVPVGDVSGLAVCDSETPNCVTVAVAGAGVAIYKARLTKL